ncbi:unnamed protein product [Anisakis simplex]|uniref:Uncharacterized protein n=1 Tax=Anisakis simplex TaxID=6269 RepID=A0A0M3JKU8_ANISI|nr:unnamed protein product [Anisakis simplex]
MSRGVSLDNARTPLIITTASSTPSVPSYSTSTQQANSASLTATKVSDSP